MLSEQERSGVYDFFSLRVSQRRDILKRHGLWEPHQSSLTTFEHDKRILLRAKDAGKLSAIFDDARAALHDTPGEHTP